MCDIDSGYDASSDLGGSFDSDGGNNVLDISVDAEIETLDVKDDTVSEVAEPDVEMLDIDGEATDIDSDSDSVGEAFFDNFNLDELDDGHYHATHLSEEEVQQIDDLWKDEHKSADVEPYHAKHLTEEEVARIGEINQDKALDVEPYHAVPNDLNTISEADADRFAAEIEALSLDELEAEQERLDKLRSDADLDIFGAYDSEIKDGWTAEQYRELVDGLPKETLEHLREGLKSRDKDVMEYFGITSDGEDTDDSEKLTLKRTR